MTLTILSPFIAPITSNIEVGMTTHPVKKPTKSPVDVIFSLINPSEAKKMMINITTKLIADFTCILRQNVQVFVHENLQSFLMWFTIG